MTRTVHGTDELTRRQREVLVALERLHQRDGFPPTVRELGDEVGLASSSSVMWHLSVLEDRGLIERRPGRSRTIRITSET